MNAPLQKRLERLCAGLVQAEDAMRSHRARLEARVAVGAKLRRMLAARGVDPATVAALRRVAEAADELAAMPAAGEHGAEPEAAAYGDEREAEEFYCELATLALRHYGGGERPDAGASLMEWHAWCLVTPPSRHHPDNRREPEAALGQHRLPPAGSAPQ